MVFAIYFKQDKLILSVHALKRAKAGFLILTGDSFHEPFRYFKAGRRQSAYRNK
ncbi:hypothetical protein CRENPOLYSF1_930005 [Crenothrix polyspora]|uniref:Uncharacterized protein n=1 Tax=Crenothrix polyspora TaxID=360316 RepID=A0A1R4HJZ7_9GAMM|nr:hypothetical protein CRENPOLYSF1_930005 [Crenothrix polyspora]